LSAFRFYTNMATSRQLCDKTECPICTEVYRDRRVLPCGRILPPVHRSVERTGLSTLQETVNGAGDLPKNFALVDVLETKELSSGCEACSGDEVKVPRVYCVECEQKRCPNCKEGHKKFSVTRRHKTMGVDSISTGLFN